MSSTIDTNDVNRFAKVLTQGDSVVYLPLRGENSIETHLNRRDPHFWRLTRERIKVQAYFDSLMDAIGRLDGVQFSVAELVGLLLNLEG